MAIAGGRENNSSRLYHNESHGHPVMDGLKPCGSKGEDKRMVMIMFILDNPNQLDKVLEAWMDAGVSGITVQESTGVHQLREQGGLQTFLGFRRLSQTSKYSHFTLFSIVDEEIIQRVVKATEGIVGSLNTPNTGILFTLPVGQVWGLDKTPASPTEGQEPA